ncbi:MAG: hypothetical protein U0470_11095 [Anaerolineae bacterium]
MSTEPRPPSVRARPRTPIERRFGAAPFGPLPGASVAGAVLGVAAALALFLMLLFASGAPPPGAPVSRPPAQPATPEPRWSGLATRIIGLALDGDALFVAGPVGHGAAAAAAEAAALAAAIAAAPGGPRLSSVEVLPDTIAAAANRLAAPLAAGHVWVAWPLEHKVEGVDTIADAVPPDDPLLAWLDAHGRAVPPLDGGLVGDGAAWALGAWEHIPTLDGGDYPPVVVPETLGAVELVGWSIAPSPLRAGRGTRIRAAWRVGREGASGVRIVFVLVGAGRDRASSHGGTLLVGGGTAKGLPAADIGVLVQDLHVPTSVAPGAYDLAVNAVDTATGRAVAPWPGRVIGAVIVATP